MSSSAAATLAAAKAKSSKKDTPASATAATKSAAKSKKGGLAFGKAVNTAGLTIFTRQLAILVNAGMPIMRGLETLARQEKNVRFKAVIESLAESIKGGGNFSDGLLQHPKLFERLYVNMVKAGEAGGVLGTVLDRLAKFMEKAEKIKGKVKSAMTYPLIIATVAVVIVGVLMVFVIPKFEKLFKDMLGNKPLPTLTQWVINFSNFIQHQWPIAIGLLIGCFVGFKVFKSTKFGTSVIDWVLLKAPGVGPLLLRASVGRFTRTFGTLLASGVPILQAINITRDTSGNVHVAAALDLVHDRVKEGDNVAKPLDASKIFPSMVTSMIEVGEETGALPDMLNRIADIYDDEVDNAVSGLTSIIEPVMIAGMAGVVGTIVIALFLPIIKIIEYTMSGGGK
jgi:type IV pilus assembly protein PilC